MIDKFESIFNNYVNGNTKDWKKSVKKLSKIQRRNFINFIIDEYDEDTIAFTIAMIIIGGDL